MNTKDHIRFKYSRTHNRTAKINFADDNSKEDKNWTVYPMTVRENRENSKIPNGNLHSYIDTMIFRRRSYQFNWVYKHVCKYKSSKSHKLLFSLSTLLPHLEFLGPTVYKI